MISIIVPVYNTAPELENCIRSILAQTCRDLELIAVDDGSTDGSGDILDTLSKLDPRMRVIHQENAGVTAARMSGIAAAKGDWIGFVDGDDYIEPDMYARLLENARNHHADISHCGYRMVFADGRVNFFHNTGTLVVRDMLTGLKDLLEGTRIEPGLWNKLFRRDLFQDLIPDPTIRINEDLLMNYLLFSRAERSVFEDFCPYHYIVRSSSASRSQLNLYRIWDPIRVKQIIMELNIPGMDADARRAYLSTCVNVYSGLMLDKSRAFGSEEPNIRALLAENRDNLHLLGKKQQLLANMILYIPRVYRYLYRLYARYLQKNRYE